MLSQATAEAPIDPVRWVCSPVEHFTSIAEFLSPVVGQPHGTVEAGPMQPLLAGGSADAHIDRVGSAVVTSASPAVASPAVASPVVGAEAAAEVRRRLAPGQTSCENGHVCRYYGPNPIFDELNFDHMLGAAITIFQCVSGEGWCAVTLPLLYRYAAITIFFRRYSCLPLFMLAHLRHRRHRRADFMYVTVRGYGGVAYIYFVSLVVFGSFYVMNLFLAVLWQTYYEQPQFNVQQIKTKARRRASVMLQGGASEDKEVRCADWSNLPTLVARLPNMEVHALIWAVARSLICLAGAPLPLLDALRRFSPLLRTDE